MRFHEPLSFTDEGSAIGPEQLTLCVVERTCLTLFVASGAVYTVVVPFAVRRVCALPLGLLVQRDSTAVGPHPPVEEPVSLVPSSALPAGVEPLLFSLQQPLEEMQPVTRAGAAKYETRDLVYVCQDAAWPVAVLFDVAQQRHVVVQLRNYSVVQESFMPALALQCSLCTQDLCVQPTPCVGLAQRVFATQGLTSATVVLNLLLQQENDKVLLGLTVLASEIDGGFTCQPAYTLSATDAVPLFSLNSRRARHRRSSPCTAVHEPDDRDADLDTELSVLGDPDPGMQGGVQVTSRSPSPGEVLLLSPDGRLALVAQGERLAGVLPLASMPGATVLADVTPDIVALSDAVGNRFSAQLASGAILRFMVSAEPQYMPLVVCLEALQGLEVAVSGHCRAAGSLLLHLRRAYLPLLASGVSEWAAFVSCCLELTGGRPTACPSVSLTSTVASNDDWAYLVGVNAFRDNLDLSSEASPSTAAVAVTTMGHDVKPAICHDPPASIPVAVATDVPMAAHASCLLLVLHLAYEDSKTNMLRQRVLSPLAQLLRAMAVQLGWASYADYYLRDFPAADWTASTLKEPTGPAAVVPSPEACDRPPQTPPNLSRWLAMILQGNCTTQAAPYPQIGLRGTDTLCRIYALFGQKNLQSRTLARALVMEMTNTGLGLNELESLAIGIALPLREAIQ